MASDKSDRIMQLVKINRALAHDLDMSRRFASDLGRERDALTVKVEELNYQNNKAGGADKLELLEHTIESMKSELTQERQKAQEMQRQMQHQLQHLRREHAANEKKHERQLKELTESQKAMQRVLLWIFHNVDTEPALETPWYV